MLLLHANLGLTYTSDHESYCGESSLAACSLAVTSLPDDEVPRVIHVVAAFPTTGAPRLKALSFGIAYDSARVVIVAHGTCADFEVQDDRWPRPHSGTGQSWTVPKTSVLVDACWFAAYAYAGSDSTTLEVIPHPLRGGEFVDDSLPPVVDEVAAYGAIGFGASGSAPCPATGDSGPDSPPGEDGDGEPDLPDDGGVEGDGAETPEGGEDGGGGVPDSPLESWPLTYIRLSGGADTTCLELARQLAGDHGFRLLSVMAPDGIIGLVPESVLAGVAADARVSLAATDTIPGIPPFSGSPGDPIDTRRIWNLCLAPPDTTLRFEPDTLFNCIIDERELPPSGPDEQTSTYMMGVVGVQLVFPESIDDQECDPREGIYTENWTGEQIPSAYAWTQTALRRVFQEADPDRDLVFFYPSYEVVEIPYEPVTIPCGDFMWQYSVYAVLGHYVANDWSASGFAYNNALRAQWGTDWFVHRFYVNDACDEDDHFPGACPEAYSSYYGPRDVILHSKLPPEHIYNAHEFAHLFGAPDEYSGMYGGNSACNDITDCDEEWGYLRVPNHNCVLCGPELPCMMHNSWDQSGQGRHPLCSWSQAQLGWRDSDDPGDGVFDPIDNPLSGMALILENPGDPIVPGDRIVIRDDEGNFVKTIGVTSTNLDRGRLVWDGVRFDGAAATPGAYDWYREAHEGEAVLQADLLSPVLGAVDVVQMNDDLHLRVGFGDEDTQGCNARVTYKPAGSGSRPPQRVINDKFWAQPPPGEVVDTVFRAAPGLYDLETLLWDVGGRHKVTRSSQFLAGPTAGAGDHPPARVPGLAAAGPNPTGGMVRWLFSVPAQGTVRARVIGIDGRCQRDWGTLEVRPGACELVWDGRSTSGAPVPAGKYFLVIDLADGRRLSRSVVLAR